MDEYPYPLLVEGEWASRQAKAIKNKLQIYFQSKKKSDGGDCRVEVTGDDSVRATVYFKCDEVKKRVLARDDHEITIENASVKLHLSPSNDDTEKPSQQTPPKVDNVADLVNNPADADDGSGLRGSTESAHGVAMVLENIPEHMNRDMLSMVVEAVSGLDEGSFSLEIIWETKKAVVTLNNPTAVDRFLKASLGDERFKRHGLAARQLEGAQTVRVENITPAVIKEMLEIYFEKSWTRPVSISMIPEEKAAVATFDDPKVAETISKIQDHIICKVPVKVYPFYESLGTALYGKDRPTWMMPEPFTENVHPPVWEFLLVKKEQKAINQQMFPYFCNVDLENPEAKLSPLPSLLKQKNLTARQVDEWTNNALEAFRKLLSQYIAFDCVNIPAWKMMEKDIRSVVKEDAVLVLDAPKGMLTVAGRAEDVNRIQGPVEDIILNAVRQIERQRDSVSEAIDMCPAYYYILQQEGLLKAVSDISQELHLSYQDPTKKTLTISGLEAEVSKVKCWITERELRMYKKPLDDVDPCLLDFLKSVDAMEMSQDLFTSQGTSAIYSTDGSRVLLTGSSENALVDAERKMRNTFSMQSLQVQDEKVVRMPEWMELNRQLVETNTTSRMKMVLINLHPERKGTITVSGFLNPVKEVARSLEEFIVNYSQVEETIRVKSNAVVQFIQDRKIQEWTSFATTNEVRVNFDPRPPRINISGARLHVQKSKASLQSLVAALCTDAHTVDKPGAKKYFLSQENKFLTSIRDVDCVVVLQQHKEEDEDDYEEEGGVGGSIYCEVQTASGVLVSVSRTDICSVRVDAVVNAANEDLKHNGGVALALLKAAGPQLQKLCDDYIARHGRLRPGDAIVTDSCNLPCKYVVHAVGPRFSDSDRKTAVSRLNLAIQESLRQAAVNNCSTLAVPAVSSGVFGFPLELCAETIAQAVWEYCNTEKAPGLLTEIHLTDNNDQAVRALAKAVNNKFIDLQPKMTLPRQGSSRHAGYSRYRRLDHERDLETTHTQEGLKICLRKGNIQEQDTDVIVNTISETLNLDTGGVSKVILETAGPRLQSAVKQGAGYGDIIVTAGFNLKCQKVFHTICPRWDKGAGQAEEKLKSIIRYCLEEAEKLRMASVSFPAIGTGNMGFPKSLVARALLEEVHIYSQRRTPQYLREVAVVLHPSDTATVESFTREFKGQKPGNHQGARAFEPSSPSKSTVQSQQTTASFSQVSSPSLGVYQMKMGQLNLEVSSGDITKDNSDVIINSSNKDFNLKMGVSKAILDSAGFQVELECIRLVNSPSHQSSSMILTSAGSLPSRHILHIIGQKDPAMVKDVVYDVLKFCEEQKFTSVAFPALGTGQGGATPTVVADAMIDAVVEFVSKKHQRCVHNVKILVFQTAMMKEFHNSMRRREGQGVEEKNVLTKLVDKFTSFFRGPNEDSERPTSNSLTLERRGFEPAVFHLCAESSQALSLAKKKIEELIVAEQTKSTITDRFISHLSKGDMDQLSALQRKLTVSIHLEKVQGKEEEACIHLEGLTRDVHSAESDIKDLIRNAERTDNRRQKALLTSGLVKWQYQDQLTGLNIPFGIFTNYDLEEALGSKQSVNIKINNQDYTADVQLKKATQTQGQGCIELIRKEKKDEIALPANWEDTKGSLTVRVRRGSKEYSDVESKCTKTGLIMTISKIERVQNETLWQSYQLMKKRLEEKNRHKNNEMLLFHGTASTSIDRINSHGFNRSYAGKNGAMYGNGSYFAMDPCYSASNYATLSISGERRMYLARVLVGDVTQGARGMKAPPQKGYGSTADLYDSVTDNPATPTMFVVFNDMQAYPEYLITFK